MSRTTYSPRVAAASRLPVRLVLLVLLLLAALARQAFAVGSDEGDAEAEGDAANRAVWSDGAELLLPPADSKRYGISDAAERALLLEAFTSTDPDPATPENELREGIRRRQALVSGEFLTFLDDRARVLFLHGVAPERQPIDCDQVFQPLEIWWYPELGRPLLFYRPAAGQPHRLWLPLDSKRVLYAEEMEYWLEQYHELQKYIQGRRFDLQLCKHAELIDEITGVDGLFAHHADRPTNAEMLGYLAAPADLAQWARKAAATSVEGLAKALQVEDVAASFPELRGQRMLTRLTVLVPTAENLESYKEGESDPEYRLQVEGVVEGEEALFESFRVRFQINAATHAEKLALVIDRPLRPGREFVMRMRVRDEISGAQQTVVASFDVPTQPTPVPEVPVPETVIVALADQLADRPIPGRDGIVLVPPESDVVLGLWRADTLVTGERISKVIFLVDGEPQFTRRSPAVLRRAAARRPTPTEQVVRVEGYDAADVLVASDELLLNQQRGELARAHHRARSAAPVHGKVDAMRGDHRSRRAARRAGGVPGQRQGAPGVANRAALASAAWRCPRSAPSTIVRYLTVVAVLDDGTRAEDVRFLNAPELPRGGRGRPGRALHHRHRRIESAGARAHRGRLRGVRGRRGPGDRQVRAGRGPAAHPRHHHRHLGLDDRVARRGAARRGRLPQQHR